METGPDRMRIDKWLWAVRLFKTRSNAAEACSAGHVKIDGRSVKPAREIRVGDEIAARVAKVNRIVRVTGIIDRRISAKLAPEYLTDLTPAEELERAKEAARNAGVPQFPKGFGRPTKKQRRQLKPFTG